LSDFVDPAEITSDLVLSLHRFWLDARGSLVFPDRSNFTPEKLLPWLGHIQIVDVIDGGGDFLHRVIGTKIVEVVGRDLTNKYVSECQYEIGTEAMLERYRETAEKREPKFRKGTVIWARDKSWLDYQLVTAPISTNGTQVDQMITVIDYPNLN